MTHRSEQVAGISGQAREEAPIAVEHGGDHYVEFPDGSIIECWTRAEAEATAEAWRRWAPGGHPPVDEARSSWRAGFIDGAEWAASLNPEPSEAWEYRAVLEITSRKLGTFDQSSTNWYPTAEDALDTPKARGWDDEFTGYYGKRSTLTIRTERRRAPGPAEQMPAARTAREAADRPVGGAR